MRQTNSKKHCRRGITAPALPSSARRTFIKTVTSVCVAYSTFGFTQNLPGPELLLQNNFESAHPGGERILFTTDRVVPMDKGCLKAVFSAVVLDSAGQTVPGADIDWELEHDPFVFILQEEGSTVEIGTICEHGPDEFKTVVLTAFNSELDVSETAEILLVEFQDDVVYIPSDWVLHKDVLSSTVTLETNVVTEQIRIGDILISGDKAGVLGRVAANPAIVSDVMTVLEPVGLTEAFYNLNLVSSAPIEVELIDGDPSIVRGTGIQNWRCTLPDGGFFDVDLPTVNFTLFESIEKPKFEIVYEVQSGTPIGFSLELVGYPSFEIQLGSLRFGPPHSKLDCSFTLAKIKTPGIGPYGFKFALFGSITVGVSVEGGITGPEFYLTGPTAKGSGRFHMGFGFNTVDGWSGTGGIPTWNSETTPLGPDFKENTGFDLSISPYVSADAGFSLAFSLFPGFDDLDISLANLEFAELRLSGILEAEFEEPFDYLDTGYIGPSWSAFGKVAAQMKTQFKFGTDINNLIGRHLALPTRTPVAADLFPPLEIPLLHSPIGTSFMVNCVIDPCPMDPTIPGSEVWVEYFIDQDEVGDLDYWENTIGGPLTVFNINKPFSGSSDFSTYPPTDFHNEHLGEFWVYPRLWRADPLSGKYPYAKFEPQSLIPQSYSIARVDHTLSVDYLGSGTGTVTSNPPGIDCPADCEEDYLHRSTILLTATPDEGSFFGGWAGDTNCTANVTGKESFVVVSDDTTCLAIWE